MEGGRVRLGELTGSVEPVSVAADASPTRAQRLAMKRVLTGRQTCRWHTNPNSGRPKSSPPAGTPGVTADAATHPKSGSGPDAVQLDNRGATTCSHPSGSRHGRSRAFGRYRRRPLGRAFPRWSASASVPLSDTFDRRVDAVPPLCSGPSVFGQQPAFPEWGPFLSTRRRYDVRRGLMAASPVNSATVGASSLRSAAPVWRRH